MRRVILLPALLIGLSCIDRSQFTCTTSEQCGGSGRCESKGVCSFPDESCASHRRFDPRSSGAFAGRCVDVPQVPACGGFQQVCCAGAMCNDGMACAEGVCTCIAQVGMGDDHGCVLKTDGTVFCFGANGSGELGDRTMTARGTPAPVALPEKVVELAVGGYHACARTSDGKVYCWGYNEYGNHGDGSMGVNAATPVAADLFVPAAQVTAGVFFTCVRGTNGRAYCFGRNHIGQLGDGSPNDSPVPVAVQELEDVVDLRSGANHSCARTSDGNIWCWGYNYYGQIGTGDMADRRRPVLVQGLGSGIIELAPGGHHTCARRQNGDVLCWGQGDYGQLNSGGVSRLTPDVSFTGASSVASGWHHVCARHGSGTLSCWGYDISGQTGTGKSLDFTWMATEVVGSAGAFSEVVAGGEDATCGRKSDGSLACWGDNSAGQLGLGTLGLRTSPTLVAGFSSLGSLSAHWQHTCAIAANRTVSCWGANYHGQLGDGTKEIRLSPTPSLAGAAEAVATGYTHSCAIKSDRTAVCWGENGHGQLGNGDSSSSVSPVPLGGAAPLRDIAEVSLGYQHGCARTMNDEVHCWGANNWGQLGIGNNDEKWLPELVLTGAKEISVGVEHSCARLGSGGVSCWGRNNAGQVGDGSMMDRNTPTPVTELVTMVRQPLAGIGKLGRTTYHSTCAITSIGGVYCWGYNYWGQLGDGTKTSQLDAKRIDSLSEITEIVTSFEHGCARRIDRAVWCWGRNHWGVFGNGTRMSNLNPVSTGVYARAIALGGNHTCAEKEDGSVLCWGWNGAGQIGDGTRGTYSTPQRTQLTYP